MENGKISVVVCHREPLIAAGLAAILGSRASTIEVTVRSDVPSTHSVADILIADIQTVMFLVNAKLTGKGATGGRVPRVIVVAQACLEYEIRLALNAGIHGYMLQDCQGEELLKAVDALARGDRFLSHEVAQCVANSFTRQDLTARELDVLRLLARGWCNKLIARELGIAVGTVKVHVKFIREKLGANTRTHAVVVARERGLVSAASTPARAGGFPVSGMASMGG